MPDPDVVLMITEDGPMLYRYTARGAFGGDTWHETEDDAMKAAASEYGEALGGWVAVPESAADAHEYAIAAARGDVADP